MWTLVNRAKWLPAAAATCMLGIGGAHAAGLQVKPVGIELQEPARAAKLTLTNKSRKPITAQVRIYRWKQQNGRDVLERTRMVVASPPLLKMRPGGQYIVRVVRLSKAPVRGEESYRLLVDEVPERKRKKSGVIFALRYSIPVFFVQPGAAPPKVTWRASMRKGRLVLVAHNAGELHQKVSKLRVVLPGGKAKTLFPGLAGYVLGKSTRRWQTPLKVRKGTTITIKGQGINGPFVAKARVR